MAREITGQEWADQLVTFDRQAFRLECQGEYHEPYEAEPFRKWRDHEPDDLAWMRSWLDGVRAATNQGRRYQRVRVLTDPITEYLRWEMALAKVNAEAGEDIRVLTATEAADLDVGSDDFWLLDDDVATVMRFGPDGFISATRYDADDPDDSPVVARCRAVRDRAWRHAHPFADHPALRAM